MGTARATQSVSAFRRSSSVAMSTMAEQEATSPGFYITTPIYYVNDKPHIGHAYTTVASDAFARFARLDGRRVRLLTGTDEHGQKVQQSAEKNGIAPLAFADNVSATFRSLAATLLCTHDDFVRTTEPRHKAVVHQLWAEMLQRGYIYKGAYEGWYSVRDEAYYAETELVDGKAPTGAEVAWVSEPSYFFKLSAFTEPLLKLYNDKPDFIMPASRRNEMLRFVEGGLQDLSISRTAFSWGIPVPDDEEHVIYVWLDALTNYLSVPTRTRARLARSLARAAPRHARARAHTVARASLLRPPPVRQACGYEMTGVESIRSGSARGGPSAVWPPSVHIVGKDILRFHTVFWPAFLLACGLEVPKRIYAHGWWTIEGAKMSKSLGNVIDPFELVDSFGVDAVRYFLLTGVPFGGDGDYSREALINLVNANLANQMGNLLHRTMTLVHKNCDAHAPEPGAFGPAEEALLARVYELLPVCRAHMESQAVHRMADELAATVRLCNEYIDSQVRAQAAARDLLEPTSRTHPLTQPTGRTHARSE
jgi:methionyl-tRNA synthetase